MKLVYFRWLFYRWIITIPPSLWVPDGSVVTRDRANFVVSTIVSKGRRDSLLIPHDPCGEVFKWRVLRVPS